MSPSRSQLVAAALAVLTGLVAPALAACGGSTQGTGCPGTEVAALSLALTLVPGSPQCQAIAPGTDGAKLYAAIYGRATTPVSVTLTSGAGQAALCTGRSWSSPLTGTWSAAAGGEALAVSLDTSGAVLDACDPACAVAARQVVTGLLTRDPVSGAVTGFTGMLVETDTPTSSAVCGPCTGPCTATWQLASVRAP